MTSGRFETGDELAVALAVARNGVDMVDTVGVLVGEERREYGEVDGRGLAFDAAAFPPHLSIGRSKYASRKQALSHTSPSPGRTYYRVRLDRERLMQGARVSDSLL